MFVPLDKFDKEELVFITIRDYVNHYSIQTKIETLEQLLDNERYLKTQIIDKIINSNDTNNQIKYLIRINKDLQKSNEQLIKTIIKQDNDDSQSLPS